MPDGSTTIRNKLVVHTAAIDVAIMGALCREKFIWKFPEGSEPSTSESCTPGLHGSVQIVGEAVLHWHCLARFGFELNTWDKVIDRYGPRADPLYKDPRRSDSYRCRCSGCDFLASTIGLMAIIHRK